MLNSNNLFKYDSNTIKDTIHSLYMLPVSELLKDIIHPGKNIEE